MIQKTYKEIPRYKLVERFDKDRSLVLTKPKLRVIREADRGTAAVQLVAVNFHCMRLFPFS